MGLTDFILKDKIPEEFIFLGEKNLIIYRNRKGKWMEIFVERNFSLENLNDMKVDSYKNSLSSENYGMVLNSSEFIFNIHTFEKLPKKKSVLDELIRWKMEKLFPDMIEDFYHKYYKLSGNSVISILVKRELKDIVEKKFNISGKKNIYFGCSTLEIINNLIRNKITLDFFIEFNLNRSTLVFMDGKKPYYIRKLRFKNMKEVEEDIGKTMDFVEKNYGKKLRSFSVFPQPGSSPEEYNGFEIKGLKRRNLFPLEYFFPK